MNDNRTSASIRQIPIPGMGHGIAIMILLVSAWVGTPVHAEDQPEMSNSREVIGNSVKSIDGKNLGKIKDLVMNWRRDGYSKYAVLSVGGFFGLGEEYFAVPWEALMPSHKNEHYVLDMTEEHLKNSPGFVVYRFYDRSSVAAPRAGRSSGAQSAHALKRDMGSNLNVSVARSFPMQYAVKEEFHR